MFQHKIRTRMCLVVLLFCVLALTLWLWQVAWVIPSATAQTTETPMPNPTETPVTVIDNLPTSETPSPTAYEDKIINVLLLGVDARNYDVKSRSDTMILVSYNQTKNEARMVSFMRDLYISIPNYGYNRLNAATVYGGPELLIETLETNFELSIDYYAQVKFEDFVAIIDTIGGVDLELTKNEITYINNKLHTEDGDYNNDITDSAGSVHLNGVQALWHCRNRSVGNSDFTRTDRQREVLEALCQQIMENFGLSTLTSLLPQIINATDTDIPLSTLLDWGKIALTKGMPTIESTRVPFDGTYEGVTRNGMAVLEADMTENIEQLSKFLTKK